MIDIAPDSHFPLQNLPYGIFSSKNNPKRRVGVAIGDYVLDLTLINFEGVPGDIFAAATLNPFMHLGFKTWSQVRQKLTHLISGDAKYYRDKLLLRKEVTLHMPIQVSGYTDFYSSKEHATNVGSMFRDPKNALLPNWLHIPIAYNGRASSVVLSGTPIRRPQGQIKLPDQDMPIFGPSRKVDFELELAFVVGVGNPLGSPISMEYAHQHIFGMVLLNDWSARDLQQWEYVPLGPFNSKNFGTSISPWVVPMEALEPFKTLGPTQTPTPLPYLQQLGKNAYNINLEVKLRPQHASHATTISRTNASHLYWSIDQQLVHHTVSGASTQTGDLMASGTISGPTPDSLGSLLELTWNGKNPLTLDEGQKRSFLEDNDEVTITGWCQGDDYIVGFGEVSGTLLG